MSDALALRPGRYGLQVDPTKGPPLVKYPRPQMTRGTGTSKHVALSCLMQCTPRCSVL